MADNSFFLIQKLKEENLETLEEKLGKFGRKRTF